MATPAISEWQRLSFTALQSVKTTLSKESEALSNLSSHYLENVETQLELLNSLNILYDTHARGGKIVCCGVGKSYKVAAKTVATLKSLSINSDALHPTEALHGDLGLLRDEDCLIFFTASGNTPELIQLLPHISLSIPIILLTCSKQSKLSALPQVKSLLFAELPDHLKESTVHGVPAPTISATLSLALADAVALALAETIETDHLKRKKRFSMKHPGGSIGSDLSHLNENWSRSNSETSNTDPLAAPTRNYESFTSLLSLDQLRECFSPNPASSTPSSVSEAGDSPVEKTHSEPKLDTVLSVQMSNAPKHTIFTIEKSDLEKWSEFNFLKNISLYDYLTYSEDFKHFGSDCSKLRETYKHTTADFDIAQYQAHFKPVERAL